VLDKILIIQLSNGCFSLMEMRRGWPEITNIIKINTTQVNIGTVEHIKTLFGVQGMKGGVKNKRIFFFLRKFSTMLLNKNLSLNTPFKNLEQLLK